jgi:lysozyme family protein
MQSNFAAALKLVLKSEGGYVDNPADPGGATNMGITRATLAAWRGVPVNRLPKSEVKALTVAEAGTIYRARYWTPIYADDLPAGLDYAVFDYAVNSGPDRAAKDLQRVLGVTVDGRIGPETVAASKTDPMGTINRLCDARLRYLQGLGTWATFGRGWSARVTAVRQAALDMAAGAQMPAEPATPAAYLQPQPIAATRPVVRAQLKAAGSTTINAADMMTKVTVGATAGTGLIGAVNELTGALAGVPHWVWFVLLFAVAGTVLYLTNKIVRARVDTAITGLQTEIPILRPAISPPEPTAATDDQTQPESPPASPDAGMGQGA